MKKSNIILIGLFLAVLVTIIALQFIVKKKLKTIDNEKIVLSLDSFNEIEVEKGWYIELHNDSSIQITISADSIKSLISLNRNKLVFKAPKTDTKDKMIVKINNPDIHKINLSGNSTIYYYIDSIDTLNVNLKDKSTCILTNQKTKHNDKVTIKKQGKINFLSIMISDKSSINVYCDLKEIQGELKDSSFCYIPGKVLINNFAKSKNTRLNSW